MCALMAVQRARWCSLCVSSAFPVQCSQNTSNSADELGSYDFGSAQLPHICGQLGLASSIATHDNQPCLRAHRFTVGRCDNSSSKGTCR